MYMNERRKEEERMKRSNERTNDGKWTRKMEKEREFK